MRGLPDRGRLSGWRRLRDRDVGAIALRELHIDDRRSPGRDIDIALDGRVAVLRNEDSARTGREIIKLDWSRPAPRLLIIVEPNRRSVGNGGDTQTAQRR